MQAIPRRALLTAGVGTVALAAVGASALDLIEDGVLPGRYSLAGLLDQCDAPAPPRAAGPPPVMRQQTFWSAYRRRRVRMVTLLPAGAGDRTRAHVATGRLHLVVALHGLNGDALAAAALYRPAMAQAGVRRFAVVAADGGNGYWHAMAGDDPLGMIVHEVLPRAAALGIQTARIGIAGYSMGGFGALLLAELLAVSGRAAGVAAASPAIFASYADARAVNPHAFAGPADFARNDVMSRIGALRAVPAWISCGAMDPFAPMTAALRRRLERIDGRPPAGGIVGGCHDMAFWQSTAPAALRFLGRHLGRPAMPSAVPDTD